MFTQLSTWYPALGKEAELRAIALEFVRARATRGERHGLLARLFSPTGPALTLVRQVPDLAALEAAMAASAADADVQAALAQARALSRAPNTGRLRENIIPLNPTPGMKFAQATLVYPAPGNAGKVQALLSEYVRGEQAKRAMGLTMQLYDPEGSVFAVLAWFASLAALEAQRRANQADTSFQAGAAEVSQLCRRPATASLHAILALP